MTWNLENLFRNGNAFRPKTKAMYKEKQQVVTFKTRYRGRRSENRTATSSMTRGEDDRVSLAREGKPRQNKIRLPKGSAGGGQVGPPNPALAFVR